jgi:F420-0:gamma-glutamyl ligase
VDIKAFELRALVPPKDDLLAAIFASNLSLKNGDVVAVASKVVGINEGRCVPIEKNSREKLVEREAQLIIKDKPRWGSRFTITKGVLIRAAGIDESNGNGHYILWPNNPEKSAVSLRRALMRRYKVSKLGVIITDSISTPLRRGAVGFALAWAGFEPLYDYRGRKDIFGRTITVEQANVADALAAAAVVVMGEGANKHRSRSFAMRQKQFGKKGRRGRRGVNLKYRSKTTSSPRFCSKPNGRRAKNNYSRSRSTQR